MRKKSTLGKLLGYIGHYRFLVFLSAGFALITVVGTLMIPILTGEAVDLLLGPAQVDLQALKEILKKIVMLIAAAAAAQWLQNVCNNKLTFQVVRDIRFDAYRHLHAVPLSFIDTHAHGDVVSRVIADVDQFADGLLMGFTQLFTGVITIIGVLIFMFRESPAVALLVMVLTPLSILLARMVAKHSYRLFREQSEIRGEETALIDEMVGNGKVVQAFGQEARTIDRFREINERLGKVSLKAIFTSSITNPGTRFVNNLVYAAVAVFGGVLAIRSPRFTAGMLMAFLAYANQYTKPFNEISGVVTELQNSFACAARVFALMEEKSEPPEKEPPTEPKAFDGSVEIEDAAFSYVPDKPLISDFNLSVRRGQRVAIVGPTGAGKTTVINLLMRFYDVDSGAIRVSGVDIRDMRRKTLRSAYGMVLQETWLKNGTIRENIAFGRPDATLEEVQEAAKAARAHSFIKRLPQGYDTVISGDGGGLSAGQMQLLCIARLMLALPPMLILDEATSSIDTRTELIIQNAFARMMQGRTSFIVAHRLSTIRNADVILFMKDGHLVEQGSHEELMQKNGYYAALTRAQFSQQDKT